jgi:hypothetical protein
MNTELLEDFKLFKSELDLRLKDYPCKGSHLQNYLYFTYAPVFNYTEAIIILCENKKNNAASALLRSLFEVYFNINYFQIQNSDKKLAIAAKNRFIELKKAFTEATQFIKDFPNQISSDENDLFNPKSLKKSHEYIESSIKNITLSNKLSENDKELPLSQKVIKIDEANLTGSPQGHFRKMYTVVYRQLSASVHLDILGLENFSEKTEGGIYRVKEQYEDSIIVAQAIEICVALSKDLYDHRVINKLPDTINSIQSRLAQK